MSQVEVEAAAKKLALANAESEMSISKIYWFPAPNQIRLIEVDEDSIRSDEDSVHPVYFNPVPDVPFISGIALIHPEDDQKKVLPPEWATDWEHAKVLFERKAG